MHEGWTAGPHLFVEDHGIWLFSDLAYDGVGVYGHNYRSRHIEMVGDYDNQRPSGSTLANTIAALGILHYRLGLDAKELNFHRDFSTKSCPGRAVTKEWLIPQVLQWITEYRRAKEEALAALRRSLVRTAGGLLKPTNPNAALAKAGVERGMLGAISNEFPMEIEGQGYVVQLFAEALLVPAHEWEKVQSLGEYERAQLGEGEEEEPVEEPEGPQEPESAGNSPSAGKDSFSPKDPFPFEGQVQ
ncbi:MAG: hypothetical protein A2Y73_06615 [Chloroflexi bacterium RBG_13_56_8]|nr:MAG: hypothetical protein A2Y73_06615 [Chloroflexi bacterium RBG_13_56_8]